MRERLVRDLPNYTKNFWIVLVRCCEEMNAREARDTGRGIFS
jgi:hypothetical protein